MLVFTIAFGIQCNIFIVFPIHLKTFRSNGFFLFTSICLQNRARPHLTGIGLAIFPRQLFDGDVVIYGTKLKSPHIDFNPL